jgi:hypothetical protein
MARHKGYSGSVEVDANTVNEVESFDFTISVNEMAADVIGTNWTDVEGGKLSASGSVSVLTDPSDTGQTAMVVGATVAMTLYPEGNSAGLEQISGNFLVTERTGSVSAGDLVKSTYQVKNQGTVTLGSVIA